MSDEPITREPGLDDFLRNFADWDRPGYDLQKALAAIQQDS